MYEFVWIATGFALALVAAVLWRAARPAKSDPDASPSPQASGDADGAAPSTADGAARSAPTVAQAPAISPESRRMALSLASELASLVSGVEGRAHHLIEAAPTRAQLPAAAEAMLAAVHRLRTLHTKLVAFGRGRPVEPGTTDVVELIAGLRDELQQMQLGLELRWEPPPDLPPVAASAAAVRDALLFLCAAMLRAERGATRLTLLAERGFADDAAHIDVELMLEWITPAHVPDVEAVLDDTFTLDLEAANHLVTSHGGELALTHLPGRSVRAVVRLPVAVAIVAAAAAPAPAVAATEADAASGTLPHRYGGALVLESDPAVRAVLARELKASGRAVFACADGASAHTFLQATPDRFELLIVDDPNQLEQTTPLARTIRALAPSLKICLLTPSTAAPRTAWPDLHYLRKPFGVHELRRTLASILAAG